MAARQILLLPFGLSVLLYVAFVGFEIPTIRTLLNCHRYQVFLFYFGRDSTFCIAGV